MKQLSGNITALILLCSLSGCATDPNRYQDTPSAKLCLDYLANPVGGILGAVEVGINQRAREAELKRRNESCSAYLGAAQARRDSQIREEQVRREPKGLNCRTTALGGGDSATRCE